MELDYHQASNNGMKESDYRQGSNDDTPDITIPRSMNADAKGLDHQQVSSGTLERRQALSVVISNTYSLGVDLTPLQLHCVKTATSMWLQYHHLPYYPVIDDDGVRQYMSDSSPYHISLMGSYDTSSGQVKYGYKQLSPVLRDKLATFISNQYPYRRLYLLSASTVVSYLLPLVSRITDYKTDIYGVYVEVGESLRAGYLEYAEVRSIQLTTMMDNWNYIVTDPTTARLWALDPVWIDGSVYKPSDRWDCILDGVRQLNVMLVGLPVKVGTLCDGLSPGVVTARLLLYGIGHYYHGRILYCSLQSFEQLVTAIGCLKGLDIDVCESVDYDDGGHSLEYYVHKRLTTDDSTHEYSTEDEEEITALSVHTPSTTRVILLHD